MVATVEIHGAEELVKDLNAAADAVPRELVSAMTTAAIAVEREAKVRAPHDLGHLSASITHEVTTLGGGDVQGAVGSNKVYAPYMEFGTGIPAGRSRHWPPAAALEDWAKSHGFPSGYVVARAIGLRGGLKPRKYLSGALDAKMGDVVKALEEVGAKVVAKIVRH